MFVWSQTVGASALNPVQRRLKITRRPIEIHATQWRKRQRTGRGEQERTETKENNGQTGKKIKQKVWLDSQNLSVSL